eukprot:1161330-Pelagomonas_calceolata.AAC.6
MDVFCVAGTVEQAEQPNYLAEGPTPLHPKELVLSVPFAMPSTPHKGQCAVPKDCQWGENN